MATGPLPKLVAFDDHHRGQAVSRRVNSRQRLIDTRQESSRVLGHPGRTKVGFAAERLSLLRGLNLQTWEFGDLIRETVAHFPHAMLLAFPGRVQSHPGRAMPFHARAFVDV